METRDEKTITTNGIINEAEAQGIVNPQAENKSEKTWKRVALGNGLAGIALGTAGFFLGENTAEGKEIDDVETKDEQTVIKGDAPVATGDYEEMSFSEAFAAAREEVGPGGVFQWHGQLYGTYYATEWDAMSDEQKDEYFHSVYGANAHHATTTGESNAEKEDVESNGTEDNNGEDNPVEDEQGNDEPVADEPKGNEVNVLAEEVVEGPGGSEIGVISAEVEGHYTEFYDYNNDGTIEGALVDSNDDGIADVALIDENGDGVISPEEVYPVDGDAMTAGTTAIEDSLYGDTPDYVNDADTSAF